MVENCKNHPDKNFLHPIIDWTTDDVWQYIRVNILPVCSLYSEGYKRIGCVMCPMAGAEGMKRDMARWPKIAEAYKRAFGRCVDKRIADGFPTDWRTGQEMFDWWIRGCAKEEEDPNPWLVE